ncbi:MAG: arylmalonate decarboxylase [Symploca sp. SIO1B1]|nr:arylmalonate decarboxylase [Symploca sp. SIO1C2]NER48568.1 arylmalonate decarboxylase [Symploca sp. SIO1A3]NER95420.1 arylmalonate decarboxylase [Symploca sp. SIO1B1]
MSKDALGWRKKFGVLAPSTNTIVQPDFHRMEVPGVTSHTSRIHIVDQDLSNDQAMLRLLDQIRDEILKAIDRVKTAEVDYLVMGMSAETFWGGLEGSKAFVKRIEDYSGLKVATGSRSCMTALEQFNVKNVGVITPYQPIADENVRKFFSEIGMNIVKLTGLRCPTAVAIAEVPEEVLRATLLEMNDDSIEAFVQVGTNLSMVRLADEAERWLGKPVIAINAATWWYALRQNGINDKVYGCGRLLREF